MVANANLITNGDFEAAVAGTTNNSNNIGYMPTGWSLVEPTAGYSNLQLGNAYGVGGYTLAPHGGNQFFDGTGTGSFPNPPVHLYQDFTTTVNSVFYVSIAWGGRDTGSDSSTYASYYEIRDPTTNTVLYTGSSVTATPTTWVVQDDTTIVFAPGTYRLYVTLYDPINVDDITVIVPEPAGIAVGLLLLGAAGLHALRKYRPTAASPFPT